MQPKLEVILSPAELASLSQRDLRQAVCVVFDVLRATTSMITALANGAQAIIPVAEISEALALKQKSPDVLLAGERNGIRIRSDLTGTIDFDLGNSPRDFTAEKVQGRSIVMTTTNGTRALRACAGARMILVSCFLNLRATTNWLRENEPAHLILVCSGTFDEPALEDVLAAGALCEKIWSNYAGGHVSDSAEIARRIYPLLQFNLAEAMKHSRNGRRLLANPELRDDVYLCVQRETASFVATLLPSGVVRRLG
ncbi:MAG TPA: 2-phosphosulfolactate phosphatase [Candidatus Saccharimonadales bacterium]|nr:2-phosphosulfolactate phosphatase [Candidatus Saccharimonadales bacterium]